MQRQVPSNEFTRGRGQCFAIRMIIHFNFPYCIFETLEICHNFDSKHFHGRDEKLCVPTFVPRYDFTQFQKSFIGTLSSFECVSQTRRLSSSSKVQRGREAFQLQPRCRGNDPGKHPRQDWLLDRRRGPRDHQRSTSPSGTRSELEEHPVSNEHSNSHSIHRMLTKFRSDLINFPVWMR